MTTRLRIEDYEDPNVPPEVRWQLATELRDAAEADITESCRLCGGVPCIHLARYREARGDE